MHLEVNIFGNVALSWISESTFYAPCLESHTIFDDTKLVQSFNSQIWLFFIGQSIMIYIYIVLNQPSNFLLLGNCPNMLIEQDFLAPSTKKLRWV